MPWMTRIDPTTGRLMAVNPDTSECVWDTQQEMLLPGYEQHFDREAGQWYYVDTKTDMVTYEAPLINTDGPAFVRASNVSAPSSGSSAGGLIGVRRGADAIGTRGSQPAAGQGATKLFKVEGLKKGDPFYNLAPISAPTLQPDKPSGSKTKVNMYQLEGFAKQYFLNPKKPLNANQLKAVLRYSKEKYSTPLIFALKDSFSKSSASIAKLIATYMEGKESKKYQPGEKVAELLATVHPAPELRDEVYCQLCKQTCYNPRQPALQKAWEMMAAVCAVYPPSSNLEPYLVAYLREQLRDHKEREALYATCALRRLKLVRLNGAANSIPSVADIDNLIATALDPFYFEDTLESVMEKQKQDYPEMDVPVIIPYIVNDLMKLGGFRTEGIFRIPGDSEQVHYYKLQLESGQFENLDAKDPRTPASVLSLWLRELKEPLIPDILYEECLQSASDPEKCVSVVHCLPATNKAMVIYLVKFLQALTADENQQHTKMGIANVAMVFAPNFLRCTSDNPAIILQNSKSEHQFVVNIFTHFTE